MQLEGVVGQGLAQLAEQAEGVGRVGVALRGVDLEAGAALLAVYIATSARRMSVPPSVPWSGHRAMPTDASASSDRAPTSMECDTDRQTRWATARAPASSVSWTMMANSSPPSRATKSPGRTRSVSRLANSTSRRSPTWWPSVSLTRLKSFMSMSISPNGVPSRS